MKIIYESTINVVENYLKRNNVLQPSPRLKMNKEYFNNHPASCNIFQHLLL